MTPAERKFSDVETGLMRAQCLVRVLRDVCDCGPDNVDPVFWGGIYIMIGEAEAAINEAAETWTKAQKMTAGKA
ncbi:MAG: hypothetical protein ACRYGP_16505 [Janthinobacterium lividum]